jgi:ABC-type polar amino acid transport system ATPase subunit
VKHIEVDLGPKVRLIDNTAGLLGGQTWRVAMARGLNLAAGSLLLVFGLLTMLGPLSAGMHH